MGLGGSKQKICEEEKYNLDTNDESIYLKSYPKADFGLTFTLKDDRKLGYMIYGELDNYIATIILFPGSPGTRLFKYEAHDQINKAYGIRMIIVERPGIGLSSKHKDYTFKSHANDVHELIEHLQLKTYHIVAYSAGGPFGCTYCSIYSTNNDNIKSCTLISGVGPPECPKVYGQMCFMHKIGWWIVTNGNKTLIDFAADQQAKSEANKPIQTMVEDWSKNEYDKEMIKNPLIIKSFLQSKYETESLQTINETDKSENRLLLLYGTPWDIKFDDIKCPFIVYNGTWDVNCVPNMAKFMFESITGKQAPKMPVSVKKKNKKKTMENNTKQQESKEDKEEEEEEEEEEENKSSGKIAVDIKNEDEEEEEEEEEKTSSNIHILSVDKDILDEFENEYIENEKLNVKNKHSKLIWGNDKGHLWFFEQDLWREIIFRVIFLQQK